MQANRLIPLSMSVTVCMKLGPEIKFSQTNGVAQCLHRDEDYCLQRSEFKAQK